MRLVCVSLLMVLMGVFTSWGARPKQRSISNVKKEQQVARQNLNDASKKLSANEVETRRNLNRLTVLQGELDEQNTAIGKLQTDIETIDADIRVATDSISSMNRRLDDLRKAYVKALRSMQGSRSATEPLTFIFSSRTFSKAFARMRYLEEFSQWRKRRIQEIESLSNAVDNRRRKLGSMQTERKKTLASLDDSRRELENKRRETDRVVAKLKKEGTNLKATIKRQEQKLKKLDAELERLIVAEQQRQERERKVREQRELEKQKKAGKSGKTSTPQPSDKNVSSPKVSIAEADRVLTGNFESNRGRLLFPVAGAYTIVRGFGRQKHPELNHVETNNPGIDIGVAAGSNARAIFQGEVSGVFKADGYGIVVMVRHGEYVAVYANLSSTAVKKGDKLASGQTIGTVGHDDTENRPVLHFELRHEITKLNPLQWVK